MIFPSQLVPNSGDFVIEHLNDSVENRRLLNAFSAGKNATGLERYIKEQAIGDEQSNESRTYLVKDALTGDLACYFSLRTCLIPVAITKSLFTTIPAIELSNFAVNENYRRSQKAVSKIGVFVFLSFILPIVRHVASFVGSKWLCVYALPIPKLLEYYEKIGFARLDKEREAFVYSHVKPKYDKDCIFMYQAI